MIEIDKNLDKNMEDISLKKRDNFEHQDNLYTHIFLNI